MDSFELAGLGLDLPQPIHDLEMQLVSLLIEVPLGAVSRDTGHGWLDTKPVAAAVRVEVGRTPGQARERVSVGCDRLGREHATQADAGWVDASIR